MNNILAVQNNKSRKLYLAYIKHFGNENINWSDIEAMRTKINEFPLPTAFNMSKALYIYSNRDVEVRKLMLDIKERYLSHLMTKKNEIEGIDWDEIVNRLYKRRNEGKEAMMMFVWGLLCSNHPRRFQDYRLISNVDEEGSNYFNKNRGEIVFKNFKNSHSRTAGEIIVNLLPIVQKWLYAYIYKYKINGLLFDCNDRRLKYLIKKFKIPNTSHNRKFQETRLLASGGNPYEVSKKFNHSVIVQQLHYKHQAVGS